MNNLTKTLLSGVALCALTTDPAVAGYTLPFHVTARHGGRVVNKTKMPNHGATHLTYTFGVYSYLSFDANFRKKVRGPAYGACGFTANKIKFTPGRKTEYAKLASYTETYSTGCASGPTVYVGYTYKLTNPDAKGHTDHFVASQTFRFTSGGTKYKGTMNLDVTVTID